MYVGSGMWVVYSIMTFIVTIKHIEIIYLVNRSPLSTRWQPASHLPCPHGPSSASTLPGEEGMRGGEPRPGRLVTGAGGRRCRGLVTHSNLHDQHPWGLQRVSFPALHQTISAGGIISLLIERSVISQVMGQQNNKM